MTPIPTRRLADWLAHLEHGLLQRDAAVRLVLLAALAGEHVLLIGPPGTAKSALARRLHAAFDGASYFERLLTRFSTPEELFGPLSLKALEDDRYERLTAGYLPTAGIAFVDEVFKASSAILNALLTLLNEREFDNGAGRQRTPLISVLGASNEGPADEALQAFFDRFLLRVPVQPVDDSAFEALLTLDDGAADAPVGLAPLTAAERTALAEAAGTVLLGEDALAGCRALRAQLAEAGLVVSDRRWRQWMGLMRVAAASEGRATVDALDLWLAPYVVASRPVEVARVADWVQHHLLQATPQDAPWLGRAVQGFERQLELEQTAKREDANGPDDGAGKLALARAIGRGAAPDGGANDFDGGTGSGTSAGNDPLRMLSATLEAQQRRHYSPVHIAARLAQVAELLGQVDAEMDAGAGRLRRLERQLAGRLWLPASVSSPWLAAHRHTLAVLADLQRRLLAVRDGFAALPVDEQLPDRVPEPVPTELSTADALPAGPWPSPAVSPAG